jgi:acyl carrier protein
VRPTGTPEGTAARLRGVMAAVFGVEASSIPPDASSATIQEWDSVHHLQLMLAIEEEFNIQFDTDELVALRSLALIEARIVEGSSGR